MDEAELQGWEYDSYHWTCPLCNSPINIPHEDNDDHDDENDESGGISIPSFGGGDFGGGGASF